MHQRKQLAILLISLLLIIALIVAICLLNRFHWKNLQAEYLKQVEDILREHNCYLSGISFEEKDRAEICVKSKFATYEDIYCALKAVRHYEYESGDTFSSYITFTTDKYGQAYYLPYYMVTYNGSGALEDGYGTVVWTEIDGDLEEKYSSLLPFEGMDEYYIDKTKLGKPDKIELCRSYESLKASHRSAEYYWLYSNGDTRFYVRTWGGSVITVRDYRK